MFDVVAIEMTSRALHRLGSLGTPMLSLLQRVDALRADNLGSRSHGHHLNGVQDSINAQNAYMRFFGRITSSDAATKPSTNLGKRSQMMASVGFFSASWAAGWLV